MNSPLCTDAYNLPVNSKQPFIFILVKTVLSVKSNSLKVHSHPEVCLLLWRSDTKNAGMEKQGGTNLSF